VLDTIEGEAQLAASEVDVRTPGEVEKLHLHEPHLLPPRPFAKAPRACEIALDARGAPGPVRG